MRSLLAPTVDEGRVSVCVRLSTERRTGWSAVELLAADLPEPRYAVDGLLPEGLAFLCGAPKLGKSWLGLGLGIAVAAGGYALGTVPVDRGDVLYLALEDNARRLQGRLRMLLGEDAPPEGLWIETEWERFDEGGIERLVAWLDAHPSTRLVVVDVWTRVRPYAREQGNHYQADYEAASLLQAVAVRRGVAIVALYHTRKAEASDFVESVTGTFGTAAAADTIIVVKRARGEADARLFVTGRDVEERELGLQFDPSAGAWKLLGDAAELELGKTRREILDAIDAHGPLTPKKVSELTSITHENAKKSLQRMFRDGLLAADGGTYTRVPGVPTSPSEGSLGTKGREGQEYNGNGAVDEDEIERLEFIAREAGVA